MAFIGFMIYCTGLVFGIVGVSWIFDLIENSRKYDYRHHVTADDLEKFGELFK